MNIRARQDNAIVQIARRMDHNGYGDTAKGRTAHNAYVDGLCEMACDHLDLGMTGFGLKMAVSDALHANPHPNTKTCTAKRAADLRAVWEDAIVADVRRSL